MTSLFDSDVSTATFSPCRKYRYTLTRTWDTELPRLNFIMLNPSTADESRNDPTVTRCLGRAAMWGFGSLVVTNLFAWRSTDPEQLPYVAGGGKDPIGPDNDGSIIHAATHAHMVVCAWGRYGLLLNRGPKVREMLASVKLHYLKLSKATGQPWHPLYIKMSVNPTVWE